MLAIFMLLDPVVPDWILSFEPPNIYDLQKRISPGVGNWKVPDFLYKDPDRSRKCSNLIIYLLNILSKVQFEKQFPVLEFYI